ncbi:MAG: hypothetical protein JF606_29085 [Burkholderiales bacterium]|nr:hypothetical protein [Burkholderiales bacterium]
MAPDTSVVHGRRTPLPVHRESPTNKDVIGRYRRHEASAKDVLKVTTSVIKSSNLEGAFACVEAMEQAGVAPNVITYNALISVCHHVQRPDLSMREGWPSRGCKAVASKGSVR